MLVARTENSRFDGGLSPRATPATRRSLDTAQPALPRHGGTTRRTRHCSGSHHCGRCRPIGQLLDCIPCRSPKAFWSGRRTSGPASRAGGEDRSRTQRIPTPSSVLESTPIDRPRESPCSPPTASGVHQTSARQITRQCSTPRPACSSGRCWRHSGAGSGSIPAGAEG